MYPDTQSLPIRPEDRKFIDRAIEIYHKMGEEAALLLVGSRAAGFESSWSDLDLWILGDKGFLSDGERSYYENHGQLFVDQGDYEAHWTFYDVGDLVKELGKWRHDEKMWILSTSRILYGSSDKIGIIKKRFSQYPEQVAERKLKWLFGKYCSSLGPLNTAARGMPITALVVAGQVIEYLCKICCLAERKPFPYTKWLIRVAEATHLGVRIYPFIKRAVSGIEEFLHPPAGKHFRELIPLKELRATKEIVQAGLRDLGWQRGWIDNPDRAIEEALEMPYY